MEDKQTQTWEYCHAIQCFPSISIECSPSISLTFQLNCTDIHMDYNAQFWQPCYIKACVMRQNCVTIVKITISITQGLNKLRTLWEIWHLAFLMITIWSSAGWWRATWRMVHVEMPMEQKGWHTSCQNTGGNCIRNCDQAIPLFLHFFYIVTVEMEQKWWHTSCQNTGGDCIRNCDQQFLFLAFVCIPFFPTLQSYNVWMMK